MGNKLFDRLILAEEQNVCVGERDHADGGPEVRPLVDWMVVGDLMKGKKVFFV